MNRDFIDSRRSDLRSLRPRLEELNSRHLQPGEYTICPGNNCNGRWFNTDSNVTGVLNIRRFDGVQYRVVSTVRVDLRPRYEVYWGNGYPLDMKREISWIIEFVGLLPGTETYLPRHFVEETTPIRFWEAQVACSGSVPLRNGWNPCWRDVVPGVRIDALLKNETDSTSTCTRFAQAGGSTEKSKAASHRKYHEKKR